MNFEMRFLDYLFLLPGSPILYTAGGYLVVFQLCRYLARNGHSVGILFARSRQRFIEGGASNNKSSYSDSDIITFENLFENSIFKIVRTALNLPIANRTKRPSITETERIVIPKIIESFFRLCNTRFGFFWLLPILRKTIQAENNFDMTQLNEVGLFFGTRIPSSIVAKRIIASGFTTSFLAVEYPATNLKYYLIQGYDDDPAVSGRFWKLAQDSYKLPLKKIVISKRLYARFEDEKPILFRVGFDADFFTLTNSIRKRNNLSVVLPLLNWETKGAIYGKSATELLKRELPKIEIRAFGDFPTGKVPDFIDYHFLPSRSTLKKLFNNCAIFVLPSVTEGFPLPPLEAMNCGCAVVTTDNGGANEYIRNGENGIIVPAKDSNAIKLAVIDLASNEERRLEFAVKGMETAKKYSYDEMCRSFLTALKDWECSNLSQANGGKTRK